MNHSIAYWLSDNHVPLRTLIDRGRRSCGRRGARADPPTRALLRARERLFRYDGNGAALRAYPILGKVAQRLRKTRILPRVCRHLVCGDGRGPELAFRGAAFRVGTGSPAPPE